MPRALSALYAAVDALVAAAAGLGLPLIAIVAVQLATTGFGSDFGQGFQLAAATWALSLGGAVHATIDPASGLVPGAEAVDFTIRLAPLGLTIVTVLLARIAGARVRSGGDGVWPGLLLSAAVFGGIALGVCLAVSRDGFSVAGVQAAVIGAAIFLLGAIVGAKIWQLEPFATWVAEPFAIRLLRMSGIMLLGILGLGAGVLLLGVVLGLGSILALFQSLPLDVTSVVVVGVSQLVLAVNGIVWAASWALGAGFALGAGSSVTPMETLVGPLPVVPLLGAIPESPPLVAVSVLALPVLVGIIAAVGVRMHPAGRDEPGTWSKVGGALLAVAVAALGIGLLAWLAGGSAGPGRLADVGPVPLLTAAGAFGLLAVGALVGTFVPLSARAETPKTETPKTETPKAQKLKVEPKSEPEIRPGAAATPPSRTPRAPRKGAARASSEERQWVADAVSKRFEEPGTAVEVRQETGQVAAERETAEIRRARRQKRENPRYEDEPDIYEGIDLHD